MLKLNFLVVYPLEVSPESIHLIMELNNKTIPDPGKDLHSFLEVSSQFVPFVRLLQSIKGIGDCSLYAKSYSLLQTVQISLSRTEDH